LSRRRLARCVLAMLIATRWTCTRVYSVTSIVARLVAQVKHAPRDAARALRAKVIIGPLYFERFYKRDNLRLLLYEACER
jgi:predicted transcriptional regulator